VGQFRQGNATDGHASEVEIIFSRTQPPPSMNPAVLQAKMLTTSRNWLSCSGKLIAIGPPKSCLLLVA
jgi:hypothetical protein